MSNTENFPRGFDTPRKQKNLFWIGCIVLGLFVTGLFVYDQTKEKEVDETEEVVEVVENNASNKILTTENWSLFVPDGDTSFHAYMDLDAITDETTIQYQCKELYHLQKSTGIWCYCDDYVVAVSQYYGNVGDRLKVKTSNGNTFTCFIGEVKNPSDLVEGVYTLAGADLAQKNVIEFVVDIDYLRDDVRQSGNMGTYTFLNGNIVFIEKID